MVDNETKNGLVSCNIHDRLDAALMKCSDEVYMACIRVVVEAGTSETKTDTETSVAETKTETEAI